MIHRKYPYLLSPLDAGTLQLKNRVIMGSMHTGLEEAPDGFERMAAFYAERAGAGLIITGGFAPNSSGRAWDGASQLSRPEEADPHRIITRAVHDAGGRIALQILHAGRYAYHKELVAPSPIRAPINRFKPRGLTETGVEEHIGDFVRCAVLAREAGYDGVEVMGSEGYLINQFIAPRTNHRDDRWGGCFENRIRFPLEILRRIRQATGRSFLIVYRLSVLDLVEDGSDWQEVTALACQVQAAGADLINTGIGWHEARIPTIASVVPRGAFTWAAARLKQSVQIPVAASNRINTPETAERILSEGDADLVSLARPFLADPEFVLKARENRSDEINVCIACNQACLDHIFNGKITSCLVNPRACHETEIQVLPAQSSQKIAVVGAGPAGLAFAVTAAARGHHVTLFEKSKEIGGLLHAAVRIPGKEEFRETLRYFKRQLELNRVDVRLNHSARLEDLLTGGYHAVVLAAGTIPRKIDIPGNHLSHVLDYMDVLIRSQPVGRRVAIIGAGGIGFDVAEYLSHPPQEAPEPDAFMNAWGIDREYQNRGGLAANEPEPVSPAREIWLLQRSPSRMGSTLGKTTGWIHQAVLKRRNVRMITGAAYNRIDERGLYITTAGQDHLLEVDTVVVCAGQEPRIELLPGLEKTGMRVYRIGGAESAAGLDAKRAIDQGVRLGAVI
jgi:2,4-dienoyl-CoA reductase (NADPH2)